jgi:hypothetical protein
MPLRTLVLLVLAAPVAVGVYVLTTQLLTGMDLPDGMRAIIVLFVPLFVAGVCAVPFLAPTFDHFATKALAERPVDEPPPDGSGRPDDRGA